MSSYKHKKKTHERGRERRSVLLFRFWNDAVCPGGEWDICACEGGPSFCRVRVMTGVRFAMVGTRAQRGNTLSNRRRYRSRLSSLRSTGDILVRSLSSGTLHFWGVGRFCVHIKRKHSASNEPALEDERRGPETSSCPIETCGRARFIARIPTHMGCCGLLLALLLMGVQRLIWLGVGFAFAMSRVVYDFLRLAVFSMACYALALFELGLV